MKKYLPAILLIILLALGGFIIFGNKGRSVDISKNGANEAGLPSAASVPISPLSGLACDNAARRPIAAMISGDTITRPLSGLAEADLVINMPVITDSITRLMAIYVCNSPKEIGSIRSARTDYITLAKGLDAILAHWGGSHFALDKLDNGAMDNLDALTNPDNAFYRKSNIAAPHNGFSSYSRLLAAAQKLGYRLQGQEVGYLHFDLGKEPIGTTTKTLSIGFPGEFAVKYQYDPTSNSYLRFRGGTKEIDRNTGAQVATKNVVIMRAPSYQIEGQYNAVQVEGQNEAVVYRGGEEIKGVWKKAAGGNQTSKLFFYDSSGQEIKFVPGQIWIEVVEPTQSVVWR